MLVVQVILAKDQLASNVLASSVALLSISCWSTSVAVYISCVAHPCKLCSKAILVASTYFGLILVRHCLRLHQHSCNKTCRWKSFVFAFLYLVRTKEIHHLLARRWFGCPLQAVHKLLQLFCLEAGRTMDTHATRCPCSWFPWTPCWASFRWEVRNRNLPMPILFGPSAVK